MNEDDRMSLVVYMQRESDCRHGEGEHCERAEEACPACVQTHLIDMLGEETKRADKLAEIAERALEGWESDDCCGEGSEQRAELWGRLKEVEG